MRIVITALITAVSIAGFGQVLPQTGAKNQAGPAYAPGASSSPTLPSVASNYVIGPGDILQVSVWQEPQFGETVEVRPDGKISLPLIADIEVQGLTPNGAENRITGKLQAFIKRPRVSVIVAQVHSSYVYVIGEVARPGQYPLLRTMDVVQLIAQAGGLNRHAKEKGIYVLHSGESGKIPVNYKKIIQGKRTYQNINLLPGDTVVVP